jgi:hypothetical protein
MAAQNDAATMAAQADAAAIAPAQEKDDVTKNAG